jgi:tetratricopeptide (TPR) repeat protein
LWHDVGVTLIGRDAEVARLTSELEATQAGRGGVTVVLGDPGIGKTRLLEEIGGRAETKGFRVAWGRVWDGEGAPIFDPFLQILRALDLPEQPETLLNALEKLSAKSPLLLLVDDAHGADSASLELLRQLARGLDARKILVLVAARRAESRQRPEVKRLFAELGRRRDEIRLTGLDENGVARLMAQVAKGLPPGGLAALIHRRTDGNPLFVRETVRLLATQPGGEPRTASELPLAERISDVIDQRMSRLSETTRRALAAAAVIGREIPLATLAALLESTPAETLAALEPAIDAGLLIAPRPDRFAFAASLYRSAIYRGTPLATRGRLHLGVARFLEPHGAERWAELAHHFAAAAAVADVAAERVRYATLAGEHAARLGAFDEAARHFETALGAAPPGETLAATIRLGEMHLRAGNSERGRRLLEQAAGEATGETLGRVALLIGRRPVSVLRSDSALVTLLDRALEGLPDSPLRAALLARKAAAMVTFGEPRQRERLGGEALALARRVAAGVELGAVLVTLSRAMASPDDLEQRLAWAAEILELAQEAGDGELELEGRQLLTLALLERDGPAAAAHELARSQELAEKLHDPRHEWRLGLTEAMLEGAAGRFAEAERHARRALGAAQDAGQGNDVLLEYLLVMAGVRRDQGRIAELEPSILALRAEAPEWSGAEHLLLECQLGRGDREAAAATFADLAAGKWQDLPKDERWLGTLVAMADAAVSLGACEECQKLQDLLAPYVDRHAVGGRVAAYLGPVALALGRLAVTAGDSTAAEELLGRAARVSAATGYPVGVARAEWASGDQASAKGRFDALGLGTPSATVAPAPSPPVTSALVSINADGDGWELRFSGRALRLRDVKGLRYLAALVARPGTEIHVVQLIAHAGGEPLDLGDAGEKLDARALAEYRRRLTDLADALQDAEAHKDQLRASAVQEEIDRLEDELAGAVGLGGRVRRAASAVERMRQSVTKRLRDAIRRAGEKDAELGDHLERSLKTGLFCSYDPVVALGK